MNIIFELLNFRYFNKLPVIVSCEKSIDGAIGSSLLETRSYVNLKGKKPNYRRYRIAIISKKKL